MPRALGRTLEVLYEQVKTLTTAISELIANTPEEEKERPYIHFLV